MTRPTTVCSATRFASIVKAPKPIGAGIINATGASQTKFAIVPSGDFQTFAVTIKNLSPFFEAVSINGIAGNNECKETETRISRESDAPVRR